MGLARSTWDGVSTEHLGWGEHGVHRRGEHGVLGYENDGVPRWSEIGVLHGVK